MFYEELQNLIERAKKEGEGVICLAAVVDKSEDEKKSGVHIISAAMKVGREELLVFLKNAAKFQVQTIDYLIPGGGPYAEGDESKDGDEKDE